MKDKNKIAGQIIKTQTKVLAYVVVCLVILIMGSSYALFFQVKHNTNNQVIQAGSLSITYTEGSKIDFTKNPECFEPMTDDVAKTITTCTYTLSVKNNSGSLPSVFKLNINKDTTNTADLTKLKVLVKKQSGTTFNAMSNFPKALTNTATNTLFTESIASNTTNVYQIQIYADETKIDDTKDDGQTIALKIEGVGEVDVSKADLK